MSPALLAAAAAAALALSASPAAPAATVAAETASKRAEAVARELQATESALQRLRGRATSILEELEAAEAEIAALDAKASEAEARAKAAGLRHQAALAEEQKSREALIAQVDALAPRLRARAALTAERRASLLLDAGSLRELLARKRSLDRLLASDLSALREARYVLDALEAKRARLREARDEEAREAEQAQQHRARARRRKEQLASLHERILDEQGLREKALGELRRTQENLSRLVSGLTTDPAALGREGFAQLKGRLPFPASGFVEVGFGRVLNAKFHTVTFQNGIDLRAAAGSDVVAVSEGRVVHAGPFRGYGNLLIIDHGEGYHTLYAHLAVIQPAVGEPVRTGEVVGQVGESGSLKGAYLYFEIRERGKAVDPMKWLGAPP